MKRGLGTRTYFLSGTTFRYGVFDEIKLHDISICGTRDHPDIKFFKIDTSIGQVQVTGDVICDKASNIINKDGTAEDVTLRYCTSSCGTGSPVSFFACFAVSFAFFYECHDSVTV